MSIRIEDVSQAAELVRQRTALQEFLRRIDEGGDGFDLRLMGNSGCAVELPWGHGYTAVSNRLTEIEVALDRLGVDFEPPQEPPPHPPAPAGTDDEIPF